MDDDLRQRVVELYDQAIASLETAEENLRASATFDADRQNTQRAVAALKVLLSQTDPTPSLDDTLGLTAEDAQIALTRERSLLAAYRAALQEATQLSEERSQLRTEFARRLGELDQQLEQASGDLRLLNEKEMPSELEEAARAALLAKREATITAIERYRQSLVLLEERGALIPLEVDLAQRRVSTAENEVALLEEISSRLRQQSAEESLNAVSEQADAAVTMTPVLAGIAAENKALALQLWGPDGAVERSEATEKSVLNTRKHLADVNRVVELTRRKFETFGHRGSIARWWPETPEDLPDLDGVAALIARLDEEIPEVQHRLITAEEARARFPAFAREFLLNLTAEGGEELGEGDLANARAMLELRRDLLDTVVLEFGRYSNQLVEHRSLSTHFRDKMVAVEGFLYSHLLWSRSVPRPIVPRPDDIADAFVWLVSPEARGETLGETGGHGLTIVRGDVLALVVLVLVVVFRRRIKRRLEVISEYVADPSTDAFRYTLEAVVWTAALALPVPLLLFLVGGVIYRGGDVAFYSTAKALRLVAGTTLLIETTRQLFAANGLAEMHFGWPSKITRSLHRGLILPEVVAVPLLFVAVDLALAGMRLSSPSRIQAYNNSLGRVAFVVGLLVLGISILALLRPEKKDQAAPPNLSWSQRWAQYAFPTAFLIAYPVILMATIVPAILASLGYYITGLLLAYQMERSLLLFLAVLVAGGVLHRWWRCRQQSIPSFSEEQSAEPKAIEEMNAADNQIRRLFRFAIIVATAVGLFSIWSDAFPLLEIMKRVQLLPRVELIEVTDADRLAALSTDGEPEERQASEPAPVEKDPAEDDATEPVPGLPAGQSAAPVTAQPEPLTLWSVLEAILAALITLALIQNLPSLFELLLSRRTNLDIGARVAFATLLRYSITIVGLIVVFGVLGVTWSKVQWLAAALTFGLGFGLQEIVANFVSGLILLVERPVRVGDMVTVGNLMGRVTRIQIRATTITLLDRSEMIVPNREFITTKLVNWTLSDSKRRIDIPFRIGYGTDVERVKQMVTEIAQKHPDVLEEPTPHTLLIEFAPDAIQLELRFVVDFGKGLAVRDQVQMEIDRAFDENGIEFALPRHTVQLVSKTDDGQGPMEFPDGARDDRLPGT